MRRISHYRSSRHTPVAVILLAVVVYTVGFDTLAAQDADPAAAGPEALRRGFRELELGLPFDRVEELLQGDSAFQYRGEPDVSMRRSDGGTVIDTRGRIYMDRGIFQFHDDQLFTIALYLDRSRLDYFQLYEQFRSRYGEPTELDPQRAFWEDQRTRIELERPLTVRYLDLETFEARRNETRLQQATEDIAREQFLEEF
ncbi:MAG: hypothetical protein ACOCYB_05315 [Alkalispirochaeta sp.]